MRRFSKRSATIPAHGASSSIGRNCSPVTTPTATAESVGEVDEDEPVLGDALHPRAGVGHDRRAGPQPVVAVGQRAEGAGQHPPPAAAHASLSRSSSSAARARVRRSSAGRPASWWQSHSSRRRRVSATAVRPASLRVTRWARPSSGWAARVTRPASSRLGDDAGHRRRADPLVLGQRGRGHRRRAGPGCRGRRTGSR